MLDGAQHIAAENRIEKYLNGQTISKKFFFNSAAQIE